MPSAPVTLADYSALPNVGYAYRNQAGSWGPNPHEEVLFSPGLGSVTLGHYYKMTTNSPHYFDLKSYEVRDSSNVLLQSGITFFNSGTSWPANNSPLTPGRVYTYTSLGGLRLLRAGTIGNFAYYQAV